MKADKILFEFQPAIFRSFILFPLLFGAAITDYREFNQTVKQVGRLSRSQRWYKWKLPGRYRITGEILPPWYYGLVKLNERRDVETWAVIPVNYIIRAGQWVRLIWNKFRSTPSWFDRLILETAIHNRADGYAQGYKDGRIDRLAQAIDKTGQEAKKLGISAQEATEAIKILSESIPLKTYCVTNNKNELLVVAETPGKAKSKALTFPEFEDFKYINLRAKLYGGK